MKIDLHVHTIYSWDSIIKLGQLKEMNKQGIFAITDHDTIKAHKHAKAMGLNFIPGEEITTNLGHLLAYYVNEDVNPEKKKIDFFEALDRIKEQAGISSFAHPFDILRKGFSYSKEDFMKALESVDMIEVYNGKNSEKNDRLALEKAEELGKLKTAGSDSHQISRVFSVYVEVEEFDISNPKDFLKAMKNANPVLLRRRTFFEFLNLKIKRLFK